MSETENYNKILGNLLGEENFNHRVVNASTCYFDFATRTVYRGKFLRTLSKEVSTYVLSHEIGHGLFTKESEWKDAIKEAKESKKKSFHNFINVVEDIRIEKLMKRKYPGLTRYFNKGARHLYDTDFFGSEEDRQRYLLIDKINVLGKVGPSISKEFNFTPEEMELVKASLAVEDWSQVLEVAQKLYDYCTEEKERNKEKELQKPKQDVVYSDEDDDEEESEEYDDFDNDYDDEDYEEEDSDEDSEEGDEESLESNKGKSSKEDSEKEENDSEDGSSEKSSEFGKEKSEDSDEEASEGENDDEMKVVSSESAEKNTSRLFEGSAGTVFVDLNLSPEVPMLDFTVLLEEIGKNSQNPGFISSHRLFEKDDSMGRVIVRSEFVL